MKDSNVIVHKITDAQQIRACEQFITETNKGLIPCDYGMFKTGERVTDSQIRTCFRSPATHPLQISCPDSFWFGTKVDLQQCTLLVYTEGGHFAEHQDRSVNGSDLTVLIFPPALLNGGVSHQGGELLIHSSSLSKGICTAIVTDSLPGWRVVMFPHSERHRVLPVIKGHRYVIKTVGFSDMEPPPTSDPDDFVVD